MARVPSIWGKNGLEGITYMEWMILPLKRYADFQGRSRRKEYWMFALFNLIISAVLIGPFFFSMISASAAASASGDPMAEAAAIENALSGGGMMSTLLLGLFGIYALAIFIPSIAVVVRRLHDRDMSGWWYLGVMVASLIPFVGFLASIGFLVLMCLPGTVGPNRFGPDPKNPTSSSVFE